MKKFLLLSLSLFILLGLTACTPKASILFNRHPITKNNVMDYSSVFQKGTRIYYLILMPKKQYSRYLNIQIIKKGSAEYLGYSLYMTCSVRLKDEEEKYFTDYIVINESGNYIMKVYSKDKPTVPLTQAEFYVK